MTNLLRCFKCQQPWNTKDTAAITRTTSCISELHTKLITSLPPPLSEEADVSLAQCSTNRQQFLCNTDSNSSVTPPLHSQPHWLAVLDLSLHPKTVLQSVREMIPSWKAWTSITCLHWIQETGQPVYSRGKSLSITSLHTNQLWELLPAPTKMLADIIQFSLPSYFSMHTSV